MMETFELCKKLHKLKPDWMTEDKLSIQVTGHPPGIVKGYNFIAYSDEAPRFTLEYLLDKLPKTIKNSFGSGVLTLVSGQGQRGDDWNAFYMNDEEYVMDSSLNCDAKTPLHALLELAIMMAEKDIL